MLLLVDISGRFLMHLELAVLGLGLFFPKYRLLFLTAWLSAGLATGVGWMIKDFFFLPRPFIVSGHLPALPYLLDGTFPSLHATAAVAVGTSLFLAKRKLGLVFLLVAAVISAGRVWGGVHTFIDVVTGAALGCSCALIIHQFRH